MVSISTENNNLKETFM